MLGHWTYSSNFNPDEYFGFVYLITCKSNGKMYIGKKNFRTKNNKESNWKTYTSSSNPLNKDIKILGLKDFTFEIIKLCQTSEELSEIEIFEQVSRNVLYERFETGEKKYYNQNIHGDRFNTTGLTFNFSDTHKEKLSKSQTGINNSFFGKHHSEDHKAARSKWLQEIQKEGGFLLGKSQPVEANTSRSEKLRGRVPANKGKPAHNRGKTSPLKGKSRTRKVICNGHQFNSVVEAAKFFNLSENSVRNRLKGTQFISWYYLE